MDAKRKAKRKKGGGSHIYSIDHYGKLKIFDKENG